jgi:hypothetical protein
MLRSEAEIDFGFAFAPVEGENNFCGKISDLRRRNPTIAFVPGLAYGFQHVASLNIFPFRSSEGSPKWSVSRLRCSLEHPVASLLIPRLSLTS